VHVQLTENMQAVLPFEVYMIAESVWSFQL
jgi:hypothetical protein